MIDARDYADYTYYRNKRGECVCFHFEFKKRVKTKLLKFLETNHEWSAIQKYCDTLGLKCVFDYNPSKAYCHNYIYDEDVEIV